MAKVSVIIPVYNRLNIFKVCLKTLFMQDYNGLEVIVVDDNSTEPVSEFIKKNYPQIKLIENTKRRHPSFARNQGILVSIGEYLLFLDSDTRFVRSDTISNSVRVLESDKKIAGVGAEALVDENDNIIAVSGVRFEIKHDRIIDERDFVDQKSKRKIVSVMDASNLMLRRDLLLEVGGFDPDYFYPHEDSDLCYRLQKKGYIIVIDFNSGVVHQRCNDYQMRSIYSAARARIRYQIKHFGFFKTNFINCLHKPTLSLVVNFFRQRLVRRLTQIEKNPSQIYSATQNIPYHKSLSLLKKIIDFLNYYFFDIFYPLRDLFRAIVWNLLHIKQTLHSRNKNFLKDKGLLESIKGWAC